MAEYTHGGDIYGIPAGQTLLDFSVNLNPFGMPLQVEKAAIEGVRQSARYPDPHCRQLVYHIGQAERIATEYILCGNGAADIIFRLVLALKPQKALVTAPTFSEYETALNLIDCTVGHHRLKRENHFDITEDIVAEITPELDILFLCNPNNPTGRLIAPELLERILNRCRDTDTILVVDECFIPLADTNQRGLADKIATYPNLILLRAFTKSYGMAGLRLGYCMSSNLALLEKMRHCAQPWSVSIPSQMAGIAAVNFSEWTEKARAFLQTERPFFVGELEALGLEVVPSSCNFLLFSIPESMNFAQALGKKGILIRNCGDYIGLNETDYRVCIRTRDENIILLNRIKEVQTWQRRL